MNWIFDKKNKVLNITCAIAIYVVTAFVIFLFSWWLEWSGDDLFYMFNYATGQFIGSISDIMQSQIAHWLGMNGRFVVHFIVQLIVSFGGHKVFATANAIVMILFVMVMIKLAAGKILRAKEVLVSVLSCLLFCDTQYSPPCQINYIWSGLFNLVFLLCFFAKHDYAKKHKWLMPFVFILSAIVGNCNEAITLGLLGALGIFAFQHLHKLTPIQFTMLAGYFVGVFLLCIAPSNFLRAKNHSIPLFFTLFTLFTQLRITYILIAYILYIKFSLKVKLNEIYNVNSIYINAIFIALVFNLIVGILYNRQLFGIEMLSCVIFLKLVFRYGVNQYVLFIAAIGICIIYIVKWHCIKSFNQTYRDFTAQINTGAKVLYVDTPSDWHYIDPTSPFTHISTWHVLLALAYKEDKLDNYNTEEIVIYPTCMKDIARCPVVNAVYKLDNGTYLLIQDKFNPGQFVLERNINILGFKIPYNHYPLTFDPQAKENTDSLNVIISDFYTPMTDVIGVRIYE